MKPSIYLKFIFVWLIFGLLGFLTIALLSSRLTLNYLITDNANALYREANLISNQYTQSLSSSQFSTEDVTLQLQAIDHFTSSVIWIVNKDGQVIYDSRNASEGAETADFVIEGFDATDIGSKNYMIGTFYDSFPQEMLSVLSPINNGFQVVSYVVIHTPYAEIVTRKDELLNIVYITGGILYLLSLIPLIVFTFAVYRPIKKIAAATGEYANGNLDYSIKHTGSDEIGKLADSLNFMASRLSESEEDQKRFIANVSHDFRSPLTSIRGYLEAMVDGTIPPELHEKYINIVLNETGRLTKLTNSLLSLNNLSDKGMLLEKTDFDINSAIKHTAETFEGTCKQKLLRIRLILTGDTMFVYADKGKIEQVVYNLIDNAIKFSNQNSEIKVETTEKNETVFVSVKDSGIGIPKESVKYIFDRFYKSDNSRGKDKKGTGLGLSIVKEILNAHNENINVISTEGVGSEFIFTLPKSREFND